MTNFRVDVVSDAYCPWCYIGKRNLEKAIEKHKETPENAHDTFTVSWHPFYLDPTAPTPAVDVHAVFPKRGYSPADVAAMGQRLRAVGERAGVRFARTWKMGSTRDAHRLVQFAKTKKTQGDGAAEDHLVEALFRGVFKREADVTSHDFLADAAVEAGLDRDEAREWLEQGRGGDEVDREVQDAYRRGISGVPNFIVNGEVEIGGAQGWETIVQQFARVKASEGGGPAAAQGPSC